MLHPVAHVAPASPQRTRTSGRAATLAAVALALLLALTATIAVTPPDTLAASTIATRCAGVSLRTKAATTARAVRTLPAGTKVVAVAKVTGGHWSARCGTSVSGSTWWRISTVNGKSVKSLFGVSYVYGATGLFKSVTVAVTLQACSRATLRTSASGKATARKTVATGTLVTGYGVVRGTAWRMKCGAATLTGTTWLRIRAINGKSVKSLYGVAYLYSPRGQFRTPVKAPAPTPPPAPAATPTPTATPAATPREWAGYTEGIDISHWQGTIDWTQVAAAGKRFAYMKASESTDYVDPTYQTNRAQAKGNGLYVGAYHFAQPGLEVGDAVAEADHFVDTASPQSGELLPVLDLEIYNNVPPATLVQWVKDFLQRVYDRTGIRAAIYVSPSFWSTRMANSTWFAANGYSTLWIAHWTTAVAPTLPAGNWGGKGWTFWQYTSDGSVPGIGGRVDLDRYRASDFTPVLIP